MTMPHLSNCGHREDGWCLPCVVELGNENIRLKARLEECEQMRPIYDAAIAWSGHEPSTSVLERAIEEVRFAKQIVLTARGMR